MRNFGQCEETKKDTQIVLKDEGSRNNKSKFRLQNSGKTKVRVVEVDNCVITTGKRCDYLLVLSDGRELYIELKGSQVNYAVEQIIASIPQLTAERSTEKLGFICSTRCPISSTETQKLKKIAKKKHNLKLAIKNGEIIYKV
ncbi:MAG: hypothetical protein AAFY63_05000 [Cyanobacteria bacterium J06643_13]